MTNELMKVDTKTLLDLARNSLLSYIQIMFPRFQASKHHYLLIDLMERVERGELKRLIINLPPRHTKSLICTEHFPPWAVGRSPHKQIISASYGQDLADTFGRKVKDQVVSPLFRAVFPNFDCDVETVGISRWETAQRGAYVAVGVGGGVLGKGGDIIIIDDPYKNLQDAESEKRQKEVTEWYENVIETRQQMDLSDEKREDGMDAAIVVIHQRWNDNDLTAWLLENRAYENWTHIILPIECEDPEDDILGRVQGEPLWAKAYGTAFIERMKAGGEYRFQAMYQQNPAPKGGRVFKEEWFLERWSELPKGNAIKVMSVDTASKDKKRNDFSACGVFEVYGSRIYMTGAWKEKLDYPSLKNRLAAEINQKRPNFVLIEDRNVGVGLIQDLRLMQLDRLLVPCQIVEINPGHLSKEMRAQISSAVPQARRVVLPADAIAPWVKAYLVELLRFPSAKRKDYVDMSSQVWTWIRDNLLVASGSIEHARKNMDSRGQVGFHTLTPAAALRRMFGGKHQE